MPTGLPAELTAFDRTQTHDDLARPLKSATQSIKGRTVIVSTHDPRLLGVAHPMELIARYAPGSGPRCAPGSVDQMTDSSRD